MGKLMAAFRRHQRVIMAFVGVFLMLGFVVGGVVNQYMGSASADAQKAANGVVVSLATGDLREVDLVNLRSARNYCRRFMEYVRALSMEKNATPKMSLGVPNTDSEASLIETALLARRATEMGIVVSDEAILNFLDRYSERTLRKSDYASILQNVTQGTMSQHQFFDAMRREMLALRYKDLFQRGLFPSTPATTYSLYQRLNRQLSFEAVTFPAADYLARVEEPEETAVAALYEEAKNRFGYPYAPEPGFKKLKKVSIEYVKGDLESFLTKAKAAITDEEVKAYYEANRDEFKVSTLPSTGGLGAEGAAGLPGSEPLDPAAAPTNSPSTSATEAGASPAPTTGPTDAPSLPSADSALPSLDPASGSQVPSSPADNITPPAQPAQGDPTDAGPQVNSVPEGEAPANTEAAPSTETAPPAEATTPGTDAPADTPTVDAPAAINETPATATPEASAELPATESTPGDTTSESAASGDGLEGLPDAPGGPATATHRTLEDAADEIRVRLAIPTARKNLDDALNRVRSQMKAYFSQFIAWEMTPEKERPAQPASPNLAQLAAEVGLTSGLVPLVDYFQLQETDKVTNQPLYEIARAFDVNGQSFISYAFADDLRRYEMRSIGGDLRDIEYLFWKTDERAEVVPPLDEVRAEVVRAIKLKQAIELAKQDAQKVADELSKSGQRPSDAYRNDVNRRVVSIEGVTWVTASPLPNRPPYQTPLQGIQYPGDDLYQGVFTLDANQTAVVVNNPRDTAYAVFVTKIHSDDNQLRQQFLLSGPSPETNYLAAVDLQNSMSQWYQGLEKELGVKWQREARPDTQAGRR